MKNGNEKLKSKERVEKLLQGQKIDRVPVFTFILGFASHSTGCTITDIYSIPERSFKAQLRTKEIYGYDSSPFYGYARYGAWEFGGNVKFPSSQYEQAPSVQGRLPVESEDDVENLSLPDVKTAGAIPLAMKFSKLQDKYGMPISAVVGGAFTVAANISSEARLCRWMLKKPDIVHKILRLTTDHLTAVIKYWVETFGTDRFIPQIWEPTASNQIISPGLFEKFVFPYQHELHNNILQMGVKHIFCHICGEQNQNLPFWKDIPMGNPGIVSFGNEVDLTTAIKYLGDKCVIAGNIQPSVIQTGTPNQVYELCKEAIIKAKHAPKGFILMPGCEMPVHSPSENVHIFVKAANDIGLYDS